MPEDTQLVLDLKAQAQQAGFVLCEICPTTTPAHYEHYQDWLMQGYQAEMAYLATPEAQARRADARAILPTCRSLVLLATPYYQDSPSQPAPTTATGQFARYAWGADYHDVLLKRLQELLAWLETTVGRPINNRLYVDTGAVLERDVAQQAGLGWIGKNAMLIHPKHGSWLLLSEMLLDLALPVSSAPVTDHCGSCTRCIEACPTSALKPGRLLDSNLCIAYHTIENKGAVPIDLRAQFGNWVFGCDICQTVCPWQRFARPTPDPAFAALSPRPQADLVALLAQTPAEFAQQFKGSAVKRSKRRGLLRNVAIALGNAKDPATLPAIAHALQHEQEPLVRAHLAWALGQFPPQLAKPILLTALQIEQDATVLGEIHTALAAF